MNRRGASRIVLLVVLCSLSRASAQVKTETLIPVMPGRLVATDAGHRLHVWCTGDGSPAVILVTGGGSFSIDWAGVQPAIAGKTRVCSYDRAGFAWSDPGPEPRGVDTSAAGRTTITPSSETVRSTTVTMPKSRSMRMSEAISAAKPAMAVMPDAITAAPVDA